MLVESFIGVDLAETTAAVTALAVLVQDSEIADNIDHSFLVYVDHALGTVVRDAFPTPVSIEVGRPWASR